MRNRYVLLADVIGVALAAFGAFAMRFAKDHASCSIRERI